MNHYVGIDLGGTELKIGIIDERGNILHKDSFKTDTAQPAKQIVEHMASCTRAVVKQAGLALAQISGVGIGSPGLLNPEKGQLKIVVNIPTLNDVFIAPELTRILGIPAFLDNDVNAMALAEMYYGAARGYRHVVCLTLGTGVGGGLIFEGKLYRGASFTAGEIGHMSIDPDGLHCPCGNYGCLERYVGRDGIVTRFKTFLNKGISSSISQFLEKGEITPRSISRAAESNDALSLEVLTETGKILGIALASLANVLNPEVFVVGGGIANAGDLILEPSRHELKKRAYTIPAQAVKVLQAKLRNDAGIVGAASLAVSQI